MKSFTINEKVTLEAGSCETLPCAVYDKTFNEFIYNGTDILLKIDEIQKSKCLCANLRITKGRLLDFLNEADSVEMEDLYFVIETKTHRISIRLNDVK